MRESLTLTKYIQLQLNLTLPLTNIWIKIGKSTVADKLDFYAARYTWATLFMNECEGSESEAAFCLNHLSEHKVTTGYVKKDFARIDRANRKVLDCAMKQIYYFKLKFICISYKRKFWWRNKCCDFTPNFSCEKPKFKEKRIITIKNIFASLVSTKVLINALISRFI